MNRVLFAGLLLFVGVYLSGCSKKQNLYNKGVYLFQQGRVEEALEKFQQVIQQDPSFGEALLGIGACRNRFAQKLWKQKKEKESLHQYLGAIQAWKALADLFQLAKWKEWKQLQKKYKDYQKKSKGKKGKFPQPKWLSRYLLLQAYWKSAPGFQVYRNHPQKREKILQELDKFLSTFEKIPQRDDVYPPVHPYLLGKIIAKGGFYPGLVEMAKALQFLGLWQDLGIQKWILSGKKVDTPGNNLEKARKALEQAWKKNPSMTEAGILLSWIYLTYSQNMLEIAKNKKISKDIQKKGLLNLEKALKLWASLEGPYLIHKEKLVNILKEWIGKRKSLAQRLILLKKEEPRIYGPLLIALWKQGGYIPGLLLYVEGVENLKKQKFQMALERFEGVLEENPSFLEARYLLGISYLFLDHPKKALQALLDVQKEKGNWLLYQSPQIERAHQDARKILEQLKTKKLEEIKIKGEIFDDGW
ncbi:MAG: tetratricopeptide repeat protein [Planctomycetota bacterium]|nr:MAG: tetratricopeptide repeat protein [Planctomycetota bacterium]